MVAEEGVGGRRGCPKSLRSLELIHHRRVRLFSAFFVQFFVLFELNRRDFVQTLGKRKRTFGSVVGKLIVPKLDGFQLDLRTFFGYIRGNCRFLGEFGKNPPCCTGSDYEEQDGRNSLMDVDQENGCRCQRAKRDCDVQPELGLACLSSLADCNSGLNVQHQGWWIQICSCIINLLSRVGKI